MYQCRDWNRENAAETWFIFITIPIIYVYVDIMSPMLTHQGSMLYIVEDSKLVITGPVEVVRPDSARSSAGTVLTCFLHWSSMLLFHHGDRMM